MVFAITMNREPVILLGVLVKAQDRGGQGKAPIPLQDLHQGIDMNQLVGKDMLMQMVMECVTIEGLLIAKQPIVATMADIPDNEY